jgi:DNA-binding CsgD family transcriptional regulator
VDVFLKGAAGARAFRGACEDLSIAEPLGPLYDLARQAHWSLPAENPEGSRLPLFSSALDVFDSGEQATVLVIEDLHWADDATLDFVRFLGRRIAGSHTLMLLTARGDASDGQRRVRRALAEIPTGNLVRIEVPLLSEAAVHQLAGEAGKHGAEIYRASAGNAFFVTELLRASADALPASVRDAVLARAERLSPGARAALDTVSVFPRRAEAAVALQMLGDAAADGLTECVSAGMLVPDGEHYTFRHEIARRSIEAALPQPRRQELNTRAFAVLRSFGGATAARLVHHAVEAKDVAAVRDLAPAAAADAARLGAHHEAASLFAAAVEVMGGADALTRAGLFERLAFESHLVGHLADAIVAEQKACEIYAALNDRLREGDGLRWLSRFSYLAGNRIAAEDYGRRATTLLENEPAGGELAMAYSNLSQLGMLGDDLEQALLYGRKALSLAEKLGRPDITSHALNNIGTVERWVEPDEGRAHLLQSLEIALREDFQEHAARSYTNLASTDINFSHDGAEEVLRQGIAFCAERDLDTWRDYMRGWQAELLLRSGRWDEAAEAALTVLGNEQAAPLARYPAGLALARLRLRRGDPAAELFENLAHFLEAGMELGRLAPYASLMAERAWLEDADPGEALQLIDKAIAMLPSRAIYGELFFWRAQLSAASQGIDADALPSPFAEMLHNRWAVAAAEWERLGHPFEQGMCLLFGNTAEQRQALSIFAQLGASAVLDRAKRRLPSRNRTPNMRGPYKAARENIAGLTRRQMDVLQLIGSGLSNKAIAKALKIAPKTVDHHVSAVLEKLTATSRSQAIIIARDSGLI